VSYGNLINITSLQKPGVPRVVPGNPDASYLAQKIGGTVGITGRRMPFNGPPYLTDGQIQIVRAWIEQGAQNN
jgi:hypothetical protein